MSNAEQGIFNLEAYFVPERLSLGPFNDCDGRRAPGLPIQQAEEAGWICVRCELITGTYHFMAIFVQADLFPPEPQRGRAGGERNRSAQGQPPSAERDR